MIPYRALPKDGIAWVTGASSGIGRSVALELARRGFKVVATARRLDTLETLAIEARGLAGKIAALAGDVTDRSDMAALVARIESEVGPINLVFLNAGAFVPDENGVFGGEGTRQTYDINLMGTINCLEPVIPLMKARGHGQIAVNASVAGFGGLPLAAAYSSAKAALINLAESLKFELDRSGVTIQVVNPGFVQTPMTAHNKFPMPFLMALDEATLRICDGFARSGFEITFPRRLSWAVKFLNILPYPLYFWLMRR